MKFQKCTIIIQLTTNNFVKTWHWTNIYCRPPRKIEFLNTYGAVINCLVHGDPIPKVQWINKNGQNVEDIHGLLKKLENNSLSLPKFDNGLYRQNIHATTYICKASNKYGTIISREIQVTAVVDQQYSTQVYDEYVIEGNTALLKCIIPSYIKDQIIVTAWIRDDGVRISSEYQQDSRYLILNTGDLNIFNVRYGDSDNVYKCQTKHTVSGEVKVTDVGGKLHVTKPSSGIQPRIVYSTPSMNIVSGSEITLSSVAQGFPAPAYSWCYQKYRGLSCEEITKSTEKTIVGNSLIIRASMKDSGFYVCKAENKMGDDTVKLKLTVFAPLSAFIHPQRQIVDIGQAINIGCVISGGPFTFIKWFKDGKFLKKDIEKLNSSKSSLHISNVEKTTEGMYQCFVGNVMDEKQAIGQIILSAVPPTIVKEFKMQHKRSGQSLTLECAATGDPLPQIQWILRDSIIKKSFGLNIESKVDSGKIWSKLTINILQISNSGIYKCIAKNKAGKDMYSNTLHVYGPPRVWPLMNQTVVTGKSVFIQCHVSGYPISSINWKKDDEDLLENERIKIYSNGSLKILSAIRDIDNGKYKCTAENEEGYTSSGSGILRILVAPILNEINDQSLRFGRRLSLYCSLTAGDPPIEFTWLYNGQALPHYLGLVVSDSTYSSTLNHQNIRGEHMGNYTCIAKNNPGSASVSAFIKVEAPPEWLMKPTSVEVHLGESISLPCTGKGFPQPKSTWLKLKEIYNPQMHAIKPRLCDKQCILNTTFQVSVGDSCDIKCKATGIGPFNVQWIYSSKTLSSVSDQRLRQNLSKRVEGAKARPRCITVSISSSIHPIPDKLSYFVCKPFHLTYFFSKIAKKKQKKQYEMPTSSQRSVIILFKLNTGGDNKAGSDDNKDFGYPLFTSIITPTDESYKNDSSRDVHFRSVAILYIIPTVTAAVILLVILIIVCILLQRQREKRTKYKNEGLYANSLVCKGVKSNGKSAVIAPKEIVWTISQTSNSSYSETGTKRPALRDFAIICTKPNLISSEDQRHENEVYDLDYHAIYQHFIFYFTLTYIISSVHHQILETVKDKSRSKFKFIYFCTRKLEHSNMRSQNLEEDDKISDFYKTSSVTSSSNKYYEIRPHHPYQQSHSSAFKPAFCRAHVDWNIEAWSCVLFSDESRFCVSTNDRHQRVWKARRHRFTECAIVENDRFGGPSVMHLWDQLGRDVQRRQWPPTNFQHPKDALTEEWQRLDQAAMDWLIGSMPRRCRACIQARGGHTKCTDLTPTSKNGNLNWAEHSTRRTDGRWATKTTIWNQIVEVEKREIDEKMTLCEECDFILSLGHETEKPGHLHSNRRTSTDKSVQCSRSSINVEKDTKKIKPTQKIKKSHKYTAKIKHIILIKQMDLNRLIKNTQINNVGETNIVSGAFVYLNINYKIKIYIAWITNKLFLNLILSVTYFQKVFSKTITFNTSLCSVWFNDQPILLRLIRNSSRSNLNFWKFYRNRIEHFLQGQSCM
ncbi:Down syndrome cell adhesion molecule-like protein Dscam2 [Nymphon striatum]|nr:Down syndrome cell adhesion molecule-like protein Dscam2 [Nymphon striatum]